MKKQLILYLVISSVSMALALLPQTQAQPQSQSNLYQLTTPQGQHGES